MVACPCEPPQHEPLVEERILMMDYATTQAQSGVISTLRHRRSLPEATMAKAMSFSPPPTADELDRLYRQLAKIHAIGAA
jgi:hypothetical protein